MSSGGPYPSRGFVDAKSLPGPHFYSHAVAVSGAHRLVWTSGQLGNRKDGSFPDSFRGQVEQAFANLAVVLHAAGAQTRDVVKLTFLCVQWNLDHVQDFIEPTSAFMTDRLGATTRPLTTLVPVTHLAFPDALFEVEAVAAVGGRGELWAPDRGLGIEHQLKHPKVDVVVVGGGFSGLQAASDVTQAGLKCILLEAKHRLGGRSRTHRLKSGGGIVELGATWINKKTQPKVFALTQKFGLDCVPQFQKGISILQTSDGSILKTDGDTDESDEPHNRELLEFIEKLDMAASAVDLHDHASFPTGSEMSVEAWITQQNVGPFAADFMRHFVRALVGREARELGLHYILDYIKAGGGYWSLASEGEDGAQSLKIKQGTSAIAEGLAGELHPGSIYLNSPVVGIEQYGEECRVTTGNGVTIACDKIIMANPTNTYDTIKFSPPLPPAKRGIVSRTKPGVYAKVMLTYNTAWWRQVGLVGTFSSFVGPICFSWETSDPGTEQYSLALFVAGDMAAAWHKLSHLGREEAILTHLAELVGAEHAHLTQAGLLEVTVAEWTTEDYIGGGPTSGMGPGELSVYGKALRSPFLHTHFAGGETAFEWKGYLEGALRAGSRAADEVVGLLKT